MALTFPLDLATFFGALKVAAFSIRLGEASLVGRTGGGELIRSDYGARLWQGSITIAPVANANVEDVAALVHVLQDSRASFLIYPLHRRKALLEASTAEPMGQINSLPTDNRLLTLKGLPAGFKITRGDFLSFTYSSSPVRYALHQAVESITANGSGVTGQFEVIPPIRPGAAVDANVQTTRARCKAVMVPGTYRPAGFTPEGAAAISFDWMQTLR